MSKAHAAAGAGESPMMPAKILSFITFALVPFLGGNHLALFYINIDKFWIETAFAVLLILSIVVVNFSVSRTRPDYPHFFKFFIPFFAVNVISLFYSWNPFGTVLSINTLIWAAGCVYLFLICPWKNICFLGLVAGGAGSALSAILQHLILFPNLRSAFQQGMYAHILREQSGIPFASYSHHNMLGGYLAVIFSLALYFAASRKGIAAVIASVGAAALIVTGTVLTSTRIGLGIIVICLVGTFIYLMVTSEERGRTAIRICGVVVLAIVICFALLHTSGKQKAAGVQGVITQKTKAVYKDLSTLNTRTDIWRNALAVIKNKPVLGVGPGAFEYGYRKYFDGGSYTVAAHSVIVKTVVELGVIGLLCFLFYLFGVARGFCRQQANTRRVFLLLAASSSLLFGLIDFSFDVTSHTITFFVLTSYFFVSEPDLIEPLVRPKGRQKGLVPFLLIIICLLVSVVFNARLGMYRSEVENGDFLHENGIMIPALNVYREAMNIIPLYADPYLKASGVLVETIRNEANEKTRNAMISELKQYLGTVEKMGDRNSERFFSMARGFALVGEKSKADFYFGEALNYYPSSPYYTYEIASYYYSIGQIDRAMRYLGAFDRYIPMFRTPHNPRGIFVYRIHDLEASIEYANGNREKALKIARDNLKDAESGVYVITSTRSRNYVPKEVFLKYLRDRVHFLEEGLIGKGEVPSGTLVSGPAIP